jgi:hypothetical protein
MHPVGQLGRGPEQVRRHRRPEAFGGQDGAPEGHASEPASREGGVQPLAPLLQPPVERSYGPAQAGGRVLATHPVQIAQHEGRSQTGGEAVEFLVQDCPHLSPGKVVNHLTRNRWGGSQSYRGAPARETAGDADCNAVNPTGQRPPVADRVPFAEDSQKGCLEGVLGLGLVPQDAPANAEDHRAEAVHALDEGLGWRGPGLADQVTKKLARRSEVGVGHGKISRQRV